ncbi:MAG: trehalose-phosphatase [Candidatus Omnitrophica bacterium]|jgi:trehalose-phosphatase|nr:trehalose-phosphatase [Candidatus Omnitrophota bacterium]
MEYLFDQWEEIKRKIANKYIFLFFDYDGTLTPIAKTPQQAVISEKVRELLKKLSRKPNLALAIISGRQLKDIKNIVGLKDIIYAGNHGLEIEGPKIKFESQVSPGLKSVIRNIYENMVSGFSRIKGVLIEDKGLAVSVHYRLMDAKDMREFLSIFSEATKPFVAGKKIKINEGKMVYEIKPMVAWDKSKTVLWLLARQQFLVEEDKILPFYFGDDLADEDVFSALKDKGLTIFVGQPRVSKALYYVKNPTEVAQFMEQVLELK